MKIISKYKDYYDYISGIYGEDDQIILDRREGDPKFWDKHTHSSFNQFNYGSVYELYVGDNRYTIIIKDAKIYSGDAIYDVCEEVTNEYNVSKGYVTPFVFRTYYTGPRKTKVWAQYNIFDGSTSISYNLLDRLNSKREEVNHPIVLFHRNSSDRIGEPILYPPLAPTGLPSFYDPMDVYNDIYNWLLSKNEVDIKDNRSDIEKLESQGFDKKESFRNIK